MRWPLKNQVLLPATCLMLATLIAVSFCNAWISVHRTRLRIEGNLNDVATTLVDAQFPLTDGVLQRMRGLSGAEFALLDRAGGVIASSTEVPDKFFAGLAQTSDSRSRATIELGKPIHVGGQRYFLATLAIQRVNSTGEPGILHILYPEHSYREAWRHAVVPPVVVGAIAIVLVVALGTAIASRVTRPLRRLQIQVDEIAKGDFQLMPIPARDDEIADLSRSVNRMSEKLARLEEDVRHNEQLRTLGQLGAGIAHQIRNSVTGCRLAIELHARECPVLAADESLSVATRQMELMDQYLRRFMALGRNETRRHELTDLVPIVQNVLSLVSPTARHLGVAIEWREPEDPYLIVGDSNALEQLLVNLLLNAIEAVSQINPEAMNSSEQLNIGQKELHNIGSVKITLRHADEMIAIIVEDTGAGPSNKTKHKVFEPFISEKRDGTGLGLTVAQEIAKAHEGRITWRRKDSKTQFLVELPAADRYCEMSAEALRNGRTDNGD